MIEVSWSTLKTFSTNKNLPIQYIEESTSYKLYVIDNGFSVFHILDKNPSDTTDLDDFEDNFKNAANTNLNQLDTDGAAIVRIKAAKKGWSFCAVPIEITTSTLLGSLFAKLNDNVTNIPGITCKIFNASDVEITTAGVLNANLLTCTKTVLDVELPYDYELIGGALRIHSNPAQDVRLWIVGAPDIPAIYGGSKEFASGINLKYLAPDNSFDIDGRVTKYITYNSTTHEGKIRILLRHGAGLQLNLQVVMHIYRQ